MYRQPMERNATSSRIILTHCFVTRREVTHQHPHSYATELRHYVMLHVCIRALIMETLRTLMNGFQDVRLTVLLIEIVIRVLYGLIPLAE